MFLTQKFALKGNRPLNSLLMFFRPNDSRMVVALGECYQKLDRVEEAKKVGIIQTKN